MDDSAQILFRLFFSAGGHCQQFWHGQGRPDFDVVPPAFPPPTTASPTLQDGPEGRFGECVVARGRGMSEPEPCEFLSLLPEEVHLVGPWESRYCSVLPTHGCDNLRNHRKDFFFKERKKEEAKYQKDVRGVLFPHKHTHTHTHTHMLQQ